MSSAQPLSVLVADPDVETRDALSVFLSEEGFEATKLEDPSKAPGAIKDGRYQMVLLGSTTAVRMSTLAIVDRAFSLRRFEFSLDPGTGPIVISGELEGRRLHLRIKNSAGEREEVRELEEPPVLPLNLPRSPPPTARG